MLLIRGRWHYWTRQWNTFRERIHSSEREFLGVSRALFEWTFMCVLLCVPIKKCCESEKSFDTGQFERYIVRGPKSSTGIRLQICVKRRGKSQQGLENIACPATGNRSKCTSLDRKVDITINVNKDYSSLNF